MTVNQLKEEIQVGIDKLNAEKLEDEKKILLLQDQMFEMNEKAQQDADAKTHLEQEVFQLGQDKEKAEEKIQKLQNNEQ